LTISEQHLGGCPEHALEKLADLVHARQESATPAQAAEEELDSL
jgi:hypothetical protein